MGQVRALHIKYSSLWQWHHQYVLENQKELTHVYGSNLSYWNQLRSATICDVLNIKLAVFKAHKNLHLTISSHRQCQFPMLSPTKTTHIQISLSAPSSLIYWPFSILVIHCPTTHLYFSTQQRSIHSNKRKLTYLSPIGYITYAQAVWHHLNYPSSSSHQFRPICSCICTMLSSSVCVCRCLEVLFLSPVMFTV